MLYHIITQNTFYYNNLIYFSKYLSIATPDFISNSDPLKNSKLNNILILYSFFSFPKISNILSVLNIF